jgi:hypothetical protein
MKVALALVLVAFNEKFDILLLLADLAQSAHLESFINYLMPQGNYFLSEKLRNSKFPFTFRFFLQIEDATEVKSGVTFNHAKF